jgi:predicted acylesterase/phospholipase RssA
MRCTNHRFLFPLVTSCVITLLAGCASLGPQLPMPTSEDAESAGAFGVRTLGASGEFELLSSAEVARRLQIGPGERSLRILALSSGGASGAFGAGALVGSTMSDGTRPEFAVVTGVSAGALVAPFAYLGPSWDTQMRSIYTTGVTERLLRSRGLGVVFGSSLYSEEPLRRLIEHYADDVMIAAIAREAAKGRLLLVATTDFASGEPVIWDLGSIALHGGKEAEPLFRSVLLASASVPGMLPPVVLSYRSHGRTHTEAHVDGGIMLPFFVAPAPEDLPRAPQAASGTMVHVIIDEPLHDPPRPTHANAFSVFSRSLSAERSYLARMKLKSTADALRERGISLDYAAIPAAYPLRGAFDFDPKAQRSLFEYAASCAENGRLWIHPTNGDPVPERTLVSGTPSCPADDPFMGLARTQSERRERTSTSPPL